MRRKSIEIEGVGPHEILPAVPTDTHIIWRMVLTFSHTAEQAQLYTLQVGEILPPLPFYARDGGELVYNAGGEQRMPLKQGDAFKIGLTAGMKCAGIIDYETGRR